MITKARTFTTTIELTAEEQAALAWWENRESSEEIEELLASTARDHVAACLSVYHSRKSH